MKVRIINSNPRKSDESSIKHLIGQEFQAVEEHGDEGIYITYGSYKSFLIYNDEYEIVTE